MPQGVVDRLLHDQEKVARHKVGHVVELTGGLHVDPGGMSLADPAGERLDRLWKRLFADRQAPHRPDGVVQFASGVVHHAAGDVEVHLRLRLVLRAAALTGVELEADAAERLQKRVVEVGGQAVPFLERGIELDGSIPAGPHLGGKQRGLCLHPPPQQPGPGERPGQHRCRGPEQHAQTLWRPPRRAADEPHVIGRSHDDCHPIGDCRRPLSRVELPVGGHDARHLQFAAGHEPSEREEIGQVNDRDHVRLPGREHQQAAVVAHTGLEELGGKPNQAAFIIAGAGHHGRRGRFCVEGHDLIGRDHRGIGWRPGMGFPKDGIGKAGDASAAIHEPGDLHPVARLEILDGSRGSPHARRAVLQVHGLSRNRVDHDALGTNPVAAERFRPKSSQRRDRHRRAFKRRMRRRRHHGEPFRFFNHHPRLEKFPTGVEEGQRHAGEPHFRIDKLLSVVRNRRRGNDCHEGPPGRFETQSPVGALVGDAVHHAGDLNEQTVVGSAEEPLGIGLAGLRQRLWLKDTDFPRQYRRREPTRIDRAIDLHFDAHLDRVWDAVAGPHAALPSKAEVDVDAGSVVLDDGTAVTAERHHAPDPHGRVRRQFGDGQ